MKGITGHKNVTQPIPTHTRIESKQLDTYIHTLTHHSGVLNFCTYQLVYLYSYGKYYVVGYLKYVDKTRLHPTI